MRTKKYLYIILLSTCLIYQNKVFAWGITGHRVIAEIAERNLTAKAKKEVMRLTENRPLAYYANWPDEIKSDTLNTWKGSEEWHYINFPEGLSETQFSDFLKNYKVQSAYSSILDNEKKLQNSNLSINEKKITLYFLIHIVGDIHQPLHTGRSQDLGGNKIKLEWFSQPTNLHAIWDDKLIDYYKYSYTEFASILNINSKKEYSKLTKGYLENWLYDSYLIANKIYDNIEKYKTLDYQYAYYNKAIIEKQLLKGGLRLAKILNNLYS